MDHATTGIAAPPIQRCFNVPPSPAPGQASTRATFGEDFATERPRLSGKPLRRPARRLPATNPPIPEGAEEEAARKALQRRMPSRSRIQAIIDRRPTPDPWLDDENDWLDLSGPGLHARRPVLHLKAAKCPIGEW